MSSLAEEIRQRLAVLEPERLELLDQSAAHAGHAGHAGSSGGGHFSLVIVSKQFAGMTPVARHQAVYRALGDLMDGRVHALSIKALAPEAA
jgi:BolA protein